MRRFSIENVQILIAEDKIMDILVNSVKEWGNTFSADKVIMLLMVILMAD